MDASDCHSQPTTKIQKSYEIRDKHYTALCIYELCSWELSQKGLCHCVDPGHEWLPVKELVAKVDCMITAGEFVPHNNTLMKEFSFPS